MRFQVVAFLTIMVIVSGASASDLLVFGYELGKPLVLPKCGANELYHPQTCVITMKNSATGEKLGRKVNFSEKDCPSIMGGSCAFYPLEIDGKMTGIEFGTEGVKTQGETLYTLEKKYGKPTLLRDRVIKTEIGEDVVALRAQWNLSNIKITFDSAGLDLINDGRVTIDLPEAATWREKLHREFDDKPPPQIGKPL